MSTGTDENLLVSWPKQGEKSSEVRFYKALYHFALFIVLDEPFFKSSELCSGWAVVTIFCPSVSHPFICLLTFLNDNSKATEVIWPQLGRHIACLGGFLKANLLFVWLLWQLKVPLDLFRENGLIASSPYPVILFKTKLKSDDHWMIIHQVWVFMASNHFVLIAMVTMNFKIEKL